MDKLDVAVEYDVAGNGKGDWTAWLASRLRERVEAELTEGVTEFGVAVPDASSSYRGPALSADSGTLTLHFEYLSYSDPDCDPDDPAVDADFILDCVRTAVDSVIDAAGWGNVMIHAEIKGSTGSEAGDSQ